MGTDLDKRISMLAEWMLEARHLVVFTGAGISTESGLADFRGPDGLWTRQAKGLPTKSIDFATAEPNAGHQAIAELQRLGKLAFLISQNVDNLHLRSGIRPELIAELHALPKNVDSYGLIHNDFNDGNFTVDYDNGDITVFDFDDCCYFWFMYDMACAWEGGIGRVARRPLAERRDYMERYMEQVMTGYERENHLSDDWLARLPLFLRLIQLQELTYYARYLDEPDEEIQAGLRYKIRCIEGDIPYLGFFDSLYLTERPFEL